TMDLLLEEENAVGMVDFYGLEEHIITFMKREEQNVCTDGLLSGKPYPRAYGSFPKILGRYVRELGVLTLQEAVHKMTKKAAQS
ncbi:D-aminoacylase, partial [bacterium 210820-DFI.6.52]|nr:D-aminoacylase [bacterium 210820-DFI.6.52]